MFVEQVEVPSKGLGSGVTILKTNIYYVAIF